MYDENSYILWLNSIFQISAKKKHELLEYFGSAANIWCAPSGSVRNTGILEPEEMHKLFTHKNSDEYIEKLLIDKEKTGADFIAYNDSRFPELLACIPDSPIGFYILGTLPESKHYFGMVGSRRCTEYGASVAYNISRELVKRDVVIVSGMADGIDSYAHKGAIDGGGKTVAVMGTGIDLCYPTSNRAIKERIIQNGCVISEYPPGTNGTAFTFPVRNRIISGLSQGIAVVEAARRSGSLITAGLALDQGRELFAVPGNINAPSSAGTNDMLKKGANVLTEANDVFQCLGIKKPVSKNIKEKSAKASDTALEGNEKKLCDVIDTVPRSVDELAALTGLEARVLQSTLAMLEIDGLITKMSGQRYVRKI